MYGTFKYNNAIGQIDLKLCLLCVSVFGKLITLKMTDNYY